MGSSVQTRQLWEHISSASLPWLVQFRNVAANDLVVLRGSEWDDGQSGYDLGGRRCEAMLTQYESYGNLAQTQ